MWWETKYGEAMPSSFVVPPYIITLYDVWVCIRIVSSEGLVQIMKAVNDKGKSYLGVTIYLDSDIHFTAELSKKFRPVGGENSSNCFSGAFDGQENVINGLTINNTTKCNGLFGYTKGATIKNAVMDASCRVSVESSYGSYVGGW